MDCSMNQPRTGGLPALFANHTLNLPACEDYLPEWTRGERLTSKAEQRDDFLDFAYFEFRTF